MDWKKVYRGDIEGVPVITKFKIAMAELLKGYSIFRYYGIFESYFGKVPGNDLVKTIEKDDLINVIRKDGEQPLYRLTPRGIDVAVALINLDSSEETSKYNKNMNKFTIAIIVLAIITVIPTLVKLAQWLLLH